MTYFFLHCFWHRHANCALARMPRDDAKRALKQRISELTEVVNTLRERLSGLESEGGATT